MKKEELLESIIAMRKCDKILSINPSASINMYSGGSSGIEPSFDFTSLYPSAMRKINLRKWRLKDKISRIIDKL